ncbi:MAG TPA: sce7726 family protein [Planktothrix sp.]
MLPPVMREYDVKQALYEMEIGRLLEQDPDSLVVDELGIMEGKYRIDVAVISGKLHGYEIKSASDNLERLPAQQESYSRIFDKMTLVADERHVAEAVRIIPPWWGLIAVSIRDGRPHLNEIWPSRQNINIDKLLVCQLLWRQEVLEILTALGLDFGVRTKSRRLMWQRLADSLELDQLRRIIGAKLKARGNWRVPGLKEPVERKPRKRRKTRRKRRKVYSPLPGGKSPLRV